MFRVSSVFFSVTMFHDTSNRLSMLLGLISRNAHRHGGARGAPVGCTDVIEMTYYTPWGTDFFGDVRFHEWGTDVFDMIELTRWEPMF